VYENLIKTYRKHLPTWHRYWRIRRRALQVDTLHPYDIWAPLTDKVYDIPYEQAVDWICAGLAHVGRRICGGVSQGDVRGTLGGSNMPTRAK
jgi:oligoendopeptidase F